MHVVVAETPSMGIFSNITSNTDESTTTIGDENNNKNVYYYTLTKQITDNMYKKYKLRIPEVKFVCHHQGTIADITKKDLIWYPNSEVLYHRFYHMHFKSVRP